MGPLSGCPGNSWWLFEKTAPGKPAVKVDADVSWHDRKPGEFTHR
jgi:hypothetical protein